MLIKKLDEEHVRNLKKFLDEVVQKLPTDSFFITPNDLNQILELNFKTVTMRRP